MAIIVILCLRSFWLRHPFLLSCCTLQVLSLSLSLCIKTAFKVPFKQFISMQFGFFQFVLFLLCDYDQIIHSTPIIMSNCQQRTLCFFLALLLPAYKFMLKAFVQAAWSISILMLNEVQQSNVKIKLESFKI